MENLKEYKKNRKLIEFYCAYCGKLEVKPVSEFNRNIKKNRNNFCSMACAFAYGRSLKTPDSYKTEKAIAHLKSIQVAHTDEYTPFRYTLRSVKRRYKEINIDLQYLKEVWDSQNGICPYSKIKLVLPTDSHPVLDQSVRASLDRIDSSKGYVKGNVQFVSTLINYMKNTLSHEETLDFLKIIVFNLSLDKDQTISSSSIEELDANSGY